MSCHDFVSSPSSSWLFSTQTVLRKAGRLRRRTDLLGCSPSHGTARSGEKFAFCSKTFPGRFLRAAPVLAQKLHAESDMYFAVDKIYIIHYIFVFWLKLYSIVLQYVIYVCHLGCFSLCGVLPPYHAEKLEVVAQSQLRILASTPQKSLRDEVALLSEVAKQYRSSFGQVLDVEPVGGLSCLSV